MARPRTVIDWKVFDKLCELQCTQIEIAHCVGCDTDTIHNVCKREKGMGFSEYYAKKQTAGRVALRRKQFTTAMKGNVTMMIWLGKQALGQSDKAAVDHTTAGKPIIEVRYRRMSQLEDRITSDN